MNATADTPPARAPRLSMSTVVCAVEGGARVVLWLFIKEFIQAHLVRPGVPVSYIPSVYRTDLRRESERVECRVVCEISLVASA